MVAECWDRERKRYCAVKIIRKEKKYIDAAEYEIDVLEDIRKSDPDMNSNCVQMWGMFHHGDHLCISFEPLGMSIHDFKKGNDYAPYPMEAVQSFGHQFLHAMKFLNGLRLTHTDLKPENILLVNDKYETVEVSGHKIRVLRDFRIKVIDFGNATYEKDHHSSIVCTRYYRPPEVLLGIKWNYSCDIWSIGCILVELLVKDAIFQTEEDREHLAMMERLLGPIPESLARRADSQASKYFEGDRLNWPRLARNPRSIEEVHRVRRLEGYAPEIQGTFLDLLKKMFTWDLEKRPMAADLINHPFFNESFSKKGESESDKRRIEVGNTEKGEPSS